jgi:hypothetical protein
MTASVQTSRNAGIHFLFASCRQMRCLVSSVLVVKPGRLHFLVLHWFSWRLLVPFLENLCWGKEHLLELYTPLELSKHLPCTYAI